MQFNRGSVGGAIWIQEEQKGDAQYRRAVQPGQIAIPVKLTTGKAQTIEFAGMKDQQAGIKEIKLNATTDSGLAVDYYVMAGPAVIIDNKLKFTKIPVRSKYPVKVTIVAYQWGRMTTPLVRSAEPVTISFNLIQ